MDKKIKKVVNKLYFIIPVLLIIFCVSCNKNVNQILFLSAATNGDAEKVKELIETGNIDINSQNAGAGSALGNASYAGHNEVIEVLLDYKADINIQNDKGFTPLMSAVLGGKVDTVKLLLERGADSNISIPLDKGNDKIITALTLAKIRNNQSIIKLFEDVKNK